MRRSYLLRRLLAALIVVAVAGGPTVALLKLAARNDVTARRGVPLAALPARAGVAHVATPLLSVRRLPGLVAGADPAKTLREKLDQIEIGDTSCLTVAVDGVTVHAVHAAVPIVPASNMKLLTATAALELLKADSRFRTTARAAAPPDADGVIAGDLYLVGSGDPLLSTQGFRDGRAADPKHAPDKYTSLEQLADNVLAAGVKRVTGSIVGDDSRYDTEYTRPAWNTSDIGSRPGAISALHVDGGVSTKGITVNDPASAAAGTFARMLVERGIAVGPAKAGQAPADAGEIAAVESVEMAEVVAEMLRSSDNGTAEMLVKEMGKVDKEQGSTDAGLNAMSTRFADWGVAGEGVAPVDGSGLSEENRLTCQALLTVIERSVPGTPIADALPRAGMSGTFADLLKNSAVTDLLRAKTGSLSNVRALTGMLPTKGHLVQFAYVLNQPGIGVTPATVEPQWRRLADALITFPFQPDLTPYQPLSILAG